MLSNVVYLVGSVAVGVGQVVDAYATLRLRGRLVETLTTAFGFIEFAWAGASFVVWHGAQQTLPDWIPVSFIAYVAAGCAVAIVLVVRGHAAEEVRAPIDLTVAGGLFGAFFALAAVAHLGQS